MRENGATYESIANFVNVSTMTVWRWVKRDEKGTLLQRKPGSARPRKITPHLERRIIRWIICEECKSAKEVVRLMRQLE